MCKVWQQEMAESNDRGEGTLEYVAGWSSSLKCLSRPGDRALSVNVLSLRDGNGS